MSLNICALVVASSTISSSLMFSTTRRITGPWRCRGGRWRGHAFERFESAANQVLTRLGQHLHGHVVGNAVFLDELAHEVELDLRGGKPTSISLKPIFTSCSNMRTLRSMSMGSISAWLPSRRSTLHQTGGLVMTASGQVRSVSARGESAVFGGRVLQHGESL
jgi:hypothetical protein